MCLLLLFVLLQLRHVILELGLCLCDRCIALLLGFLEFQTILGECGRFANMSFGIILESQVVVSKDLLKLPLGRTVGVGSITS